MLLLHDTESGRLVARLELAPASDGRLRTVTAQSFSPDGKWLAVATAHGDTDLWEVEAARLVATLDGHLGRITSVGFSPDGGLLITAGADATARVYPANVLGMRDIACELVRQLPEFDRVAAYCPAQAQSER